MPTLKEAHASIRAPSVLVLCLALAAVLGGRMFARWYATVADVRDLLQQALAGRYIIERELGHGGSASVYLARDLKIPRLVALKVLAPELALAVRKERFQREIAIAARLDHPHILTLFEADEAGGFLFYTMPPVHGESLGVRLSRVGWLPLDEALDIASQVADALQYAHGEGVIHRDIKPGNILLDPNGHIRVADFGIARAIAGEASEPLTDTGSVLGTVAYMSPEQIRGLQLTGQTDLYSLGCVLYEMLVGAPPYTGPTPQSVLAKHLVDPVPPIGLARPEVPAGIVRIVERALAKDPRDRFRTAVEFRAALAAGRPRRRVSHSQVLAVTIGALLVGALAVAAKDLTQAHPAVLDELRYVVLPLDRADTTLARGVEGQVRDALKKWNDITVVDELRVKEALAKRGTGALTNSDAQVVAAALGAGRFVRGEVAKVGDSLRLHAAVYDATGRGAILPDATVKVGRDLSDSLLATLAEGLLFGTGERDDWLAAQRATRSFRARNALARGLAAVDQWDLAAADSSFVAAAQADPGYAQAHLWVAQVRYWNGRDRATWRSSAERAAAGRDRLSSRDRALVVALSAFGDGQVERACNAWEGLTRRAPHDFAAWYGLANCLQGDDVVVPDRSSLSGWRFRSSYHHALQAYQQAFRLLPAIHQSLRSDGYETVRLLLMTSSFRRLGHALAPDTTQFLAHAMWQHDSLVFIPDVRSAMSGLAGVRVRPTRDQLDAALRHGRQLFHEIASAWLAAAPQNAGALEAMAVSLEMLGDPSCLDTLRRARSVERNPNEQLRLAANEVWVRLKFSIPNDLAGVRAARAMADSILATHPSRSGGKARLLASLAVVTGRAGLAAQIAREGAAEWDTPVQIARSAPALLVFGALGGPRDSLIALESQVATGIDNALPVSMQHQARMQWLARPAELAFPGIQLASISSLAGSGDYIVDAEAAYLRGDSSAVRRTFTDLRAIRRSMPPASVMVDGLYPEAALLVSIGEEAEAIDWLDATLDVLAGTEPGVLADPPRAGALVRAMALRAELADRAGDRETASRWAQVVRVLWSDADAFLRPRVAEMASFDARSRGPTH
jgi:serine/threonine-protein kinase